MFGPGKLMMGGGKRILFVGGGKVKSTIPSASVNVPTPAGTLDGDLLIMVGSGSQHGFNTPATYTYRYSATDHSTYGMGLFNKTASGEPGTRSLGSPLAQAQSAAIFAFRNAAWSAFGATLPSAGGSITLNSITAAAGWLLAIILVPVGFPPTATTVTAPAAGFSKIDEYFNTDAGGSILIFAKEVPAGATGSQTFTTTPGGAACDGFLISIQKV